jgi:hypothetical protein
MAGLIIGLVFFTGFVVVVLATWIRHDEYLRHLASQRQGETICHLARSLDYRRLDTKIIRAVYNGVRPYLPDGFPVRASDDLDETYCIDRDDMDDMAVEIAERNGRTLDCWEQNPYVGRVRTVSDLIEFLCALPRVTRP